MTPRRPIHIARHGTVRVAVQRYGEGRWCIEWREHAGATTRRETFRDKQRAIARADEIAAAITDGKGDVLTLTSADRDAYRRAILALREIDTPLAAAVEEYTAARRALPAGHTLLEAAQQLAARAGTGRVCPPAAEVAAAILAEPPENAQHPPTAKHLRTFKPRLLAAAAAIPSLPLATEHDIRRWLTTLTHKGQPVAPKTRDHYRDAAAALFRYAQMRQWLPPGPLPTDAIGKTYRPGPVATYSPAELRAMFKVCPHQWQPFLALGAFAGLRTTEIFRLRWEHFRWKEKVIAVPMHVAAKTSRPRIVPLAPALEAWLTDHRREFGAIFQQKSLTAFERAAYRRCIRKLEKSIEGFAWKYNALRHSAESYRLALVKNPQQVQMEFGHTAAMQARHYNDPKTEQEARAWFAVLPPEVPAGVTRFPAAEAR